MGVFCMTPEVNPINKKARQIPILNPINVYGRVFFFAWFGFMIAFWSWYAFPPLLNDVIKKDIHASTHAVANSNIIALTATLLVRLVAGPSCDRFGPRYTFAGCLLVGAIPTFLAGTVHSAAGLIVLRFFIGILGGAFVPCQVWTTGFFDKNIVGTANSLTAGFGNAGGGITYFVMPAIYNSLRKNQHESSHVAWRVSFVVPGILIVFSAVMLVVCCPDTPTGSWADRMQAIPDNSLSQQGGAGLIVDAPGSIDAKKSGSESPSDDEEKKFGNNGGVYGAEAQIDTARGEVVQKPSFGEAMHVVFSPQTLVTAACYFCTFGTELSVNSILGNYYTANFPKLGLSKSGDWAAMFGLMNVVARPLGGLVSDFAYKRTGSVWSKRILLHSYSVMTGVFMIVIGTVNSHDKSTMFGLVGGGLAFFLEGANGLNYSIVPHVHPYANGIVSGTTGAAGNLGGIVFAIIFRYLGKDYGKAFWIIGVITIGINLAVCWIKPVPKGQIGGH